MKKLIISVHDVSPFYIKELVIIFKKLKGIKKEIFIVPNWNNKHDISDNKLFIDMVKKEIKNKALIGLHGYSHSGRVSFWEKLLFSKKDLGQNEFSGITKNKAIEKIKKGRNSLYNTFKVYPKKFVAPRWIFNRKYFDILKRCGFSYSGSLWNIILLNKNKKIWSFICNFDFGSNKFLNLILRYLSWGLIHFKMLFGGLIRIAVHPNDIKNKSFDYELFIIKKLLKK